MPTTSLRNVFAYGALTFFLATAISLAQSPTPGYAGPGRYEIENVASTKLLDINRQDQRTVTQSSRNHTMSQLWDIEDAGSGFVYVRSAATGLVMDIDGGTARDGARVITSEAAGRDSQMWRIEGEGSLRRFTSRLGIALDLRHGSREDGAMYQTWSGAGQDNQRFRLWWVSAPVRVDRDRHDDGHRGDWKDRDGRGDEMRAYESGYRSGLQDFKDRVRRTYARHKDDYDQRWEVAFIEGYYDGYDFSRADTNMMRPEERELYNDAFRSGQRDARDGRNAGYFRFADRFDRRTEPFFRRGYYDGYYSAR